MIKKDVLLQYQNNIIVKWKKKNLTQHHRAIWAC